MTRDDATDDATDDTGGTGGTDDTDDTDDTDSTDEPTDDADDADHGFGETGERTLGVEFGDLEAELEDAEYPLSREELFEQYGDHEIQLADTTEQLRDVLGPAGERSYESAEDVTQTVVGIVGDEAVGRKEYTDRSTTPDEEDHDAESL